MTHRKRHFCVLLLAIVNLLVFVGISLAQTGATYDLTWWTIDGGGGSSSGGQYAVVDTIGQPDAASFSSSDNQRYALTDGFWQAKPKECVKVSAVTIVGPSNGLVGDIYSFAVQAEPAQVSIPFVYQWSPAPLSGQGTANVTYLWNTIARQTISLTATNCGGTGTANGSYAIDIAGRTISGRIVNGSNDPVANITVSAGPEHSTATDSNGNYAIGSLIPGTYQVVPLKSGYTFSPASRTVTVPPDVSRQDFTLLVDLALNDIEITQGIQNLNNDVPLVQDKITYVRVYAHSTPENITNVQAVLHGARDGNPLPGSPLRAVKPSILIQQSGGERANLEDSYYFLLPSTWRSGNVTLRAEINPDRTIPETDANNNSLSITRGFTPKKALCVVMVRVRTDPQTASVDDAGFWDIVDWVKSAYPVPDVWIYRGGMIEETECCRFGIPPWFGGPYEMYFVDENEVYDDANKVNISLWWEDFFSDDPDECENAYYFGMVHQSHISQGGSAPNPGWTGWFVMNTDPNYLAGKWSWYIPHGGASFAHELGHSEGRDHVACGGPKDADQNYPYGCDIGPNDSTAYYGFDVLDVAVVPPTVAGDLMSYSTSVGKPRWPSNYTYNALFNKLPSSAYARASTSTLIEQLQQANEVLAVTGVISKTEGKVNIGYVYRLSQQQIGAKNLKKAATSVTASAATPYTLQILDADDIVLVEQPFDVQRHSDAEEGDEIFAVLAPYSPNAAFIVIRQGETELARRTVSKSSPSVQLVAPNGGETFSDQMTIRWMASDADGDALLYTVQYSPDNGATWQTVVTNHYTQTYTLSDLRSLPGSNSALVRVTATDGVNTASDTSDQVFQVAVHTPDVHISTPIDGAVFTTDFQIIASGGAIDAEDGTIAGAAMQWFVDGILIGSGQEIALAGLTPGNHEIKLEATDSHNSQGFDSVRVFVGDTFPLIKSITPVSVTISHPDMILTVAGANFTISSTVLWNGNPISTTFVGDTQLTAEVDAATLTAAGVFEIVVHDTSSGSIVSNHKSFTVFNPQPQIDNINPASTVVGTPPLTLFVNGANFVEGARVIWDGEERSTTYVNSSQLQVEINAADLSFNRAVGLFVLNPEPNLGFSNGVNFVISDPRVRSQSVYLPIISK